MEERGIAHPRGALWARGDLQALGASSPARSGAYWLGHEAGAGGGRSTGNALEALQTSDAIRGQDSERLHRTVRAVAWASAEQPTKPGAKLAMPIPLGNPRAFQDYGQSGYVITVAR